MRACVFVSREVVLQALQQKQRVHGVSVCGSSRSGSVNSRKSSRKEREAERKDKISKHKLFCSPFVSALGAAGTGIEPVNVLLSFTAKC